MKTKIGNIFGYFVLILSASLFGYLIIISFLH